MTLDLVALCFDARDPARLAHFWGELLGWDEAEDSQLVPDDDTGFRLRFRPSRAEKRVPNQMHLDLTSASPGEQERTVARAVDLGARHLDVGQRPEETTSCSPTRRATSSACSRPATPSSPTAASSGPSRATGPGGRLLLERGAGLAAGLGPGPGDGGPLAARGPEDHPGRPTGGAETGAEPAALRGLEPTPRRPCRRGRATGLARRDHARRRHERPRTDRAGRSRRQRVLPRPGRRRTPAR